MIQTDDSKIMINLLPESFKKNSELFTRVAEKIIKKHILDNKKYLLSLDALDTLEEIYVDILAYEFNVNFYTLSISLEEKRKLVKNSILTHMKKGTPFAIENVLKIFYKNAKLKEWFEYLGQEGTFRIDILNNTSIVPDEITKILQMIKNTKRASQQLEKITFESNSHAILNSGTWSREGIKQKHFQEILNIYFEKIDHNQESGNRNIGIQTEGGIYGRI